MIKLELLAPAKDLDHGTAAINHGADAVYIGAPKFSARKAAGTDLHQIETLARYAHLYSARVYVALNTILYDSELEEAQKLITDIYNAGADALIIQDMGILEMNMPPIPLFASTQTHNTTPEKVLFLEKVGFKRIILARELSIDQIKEIHQNTHVELESFVHGALCVSYSGQCYMSHSVCGRSGNRGECAQPCRSAYNLWDANGNMLVKNKHLLSLKDLNLSDSIPELVQAGITSFKIEGRLKDITYIKNITSYYRYSIDSFLNNNSNYQKQSSGKCFFDFTPDPNVTFNRGYTQYNLHGRKEKLSSFHTQKSLGKQVGKIIKLKGNGFIYEGEKLNNGDGICFFSPKNELLGFNVNMVEKDVIFPSNSEGLSEGAILFRNFDINFENSLKKSSGNRRIQVDMLLEGNEKAISLTMKDENGFTSIVTKNLEGIIAENPNKAISMLKSQLEKLGNTPFISNSINFNINPIPFLPVAQINELRREATDELVKERLAKYEKISQEKQVNDYPYPAENLDYKANISNTLAEKFYKRHGVKTFTPAFEIDQNIPEKIVMITKHCIKYQMDACPRYNGKTAINEPLTLKDNNNTYQLKFNCKDCVMYVIKCEL
jgi:putative protease